MRRTWPALLLMAAVAATLAWLALAPDEADAWALYVIWAATAVAFLVRIAVGVARRRSDRAAAAANSAARAMGAVGVAGAVRVVESPTRRREDREDRADLEPLLHGPDTSPITMIPPEARNPFEQQLGRRGPGENRVS